MVIVEIEREYIPTIDSSELVKTICTWEREDSINFKTSCGRLAPAEGRDDCPFCSGHILLINNYVI